MGRWTQYDSDEYRLPEGFVRTGYDADTQQYTFRDTGSGGLYQSAPGSAYGTLHSVVDLDYLPDQRYAFTSEGDYYSRHRARAAALKTTFNGMLPAHATTTASPKRSSRSNTVQRSQSTRVPLSSSHLNKPLPSRSKSVSEKTAHGRSHHGPYQPKRAHTIAGSETKSSFSFTSAFKRLSRSLTTARARVRREKSTARARVRREKSTDDEKTGGYQRL